MPVLAFLVAVAFWPGLMDPAVTPRWAVLAVGLPLASRLDPRNIDPFLLGLAGMGTLWALWTLIAASPNRAIGGYELSHFLILGLAFLAGAGLKSLDGVMTGLALGIGVSATVCVAQLFGYDGVDQRMGSVPAGLFYNREMLAEFVAPVLVWTSLRRRKIALRLALNHQTAIVDVAGRVSGRRRRAADPSSLALASLPAAPLLFCQSRLAVLAVACGLLYGWRASMGRKLAALISVAGAGAASIFWLGEWKMVTAATRIGEWLMAIRNLTPFGLGLGWFRDHTFPDPSSAHSEPLQLMVEMGVGSLFWLAIPAVIWWRGAGGRVERAVFLAICVEAALSFTLHQPAAGFVAAVGAGFMARRRSLVRMGEPEFGGLDDRPEKSSSRGADKSIPRRPPRRRGAVPA
jgi:hypothetical protein